MNAAVLAILVFAVFAIGYRFYARFLATRWSDLPECAECDLSWACSRCPARALVASGDIAGRSPAYCELARARAAACDRGSARDR